MKKTICNICAAVVLSAAAAIVFSGCSSSGNTSRPPVDQTPHVPQEEPADSPQSVPDVVTVVNIEDLTESGELCTSDALEAFWQDEQYTYCFPSIKSHYIIVQYSDGTEEPVREAMAAGRITINDLDRFGIGYWKDPIVTVVGMECEEGVLDALRLFWSDEEYDYYFPNYDTEVTVYLSNGHSWPLHDALMCGLVSVSDLDPYGIRYYREPKE